ncbi:MAG: hypothetical protein J07HX64_01886 [halophilic archaeon J07HX64]|nr:MAG: hypothetical protein J07HX64_01886 [halophilic archaeon J07HX64]
MTDACDLSAAVAYQSRERVDEATREYHIFQ